MIGEPNNLVRKLALLSVVTAWSCCSCSAVTRQVARDATPAAIDSGIEAGMSEKNQAAIAEGMPLAESASRPVEDPARGEAERAQAEADAELVRNTVRRMRSVPRDGALGKKHGTP